MVADQDVEHRQKMVTSIQELGHKVQEALSGKEVIEICRKKCPDLIFIDCQLGGQPGDEIVRQIRQLGGHAVWAPLVLMSKSITDEAVLKSVDAGADDIIAKPVDHPHLLIKVSSAQRHFNLKEEVFQVAHELVVANRALQSVMTQDMMTGLNNSQTFDEALEREWFKGKKANQPIAVIYINLDFFQNFNQAYGAKEGDQALKKVSEILKTAVPGGNSLLARMTGDSFAVLLPNTTREAALKAAEKLHAAIDTLKIPHNNSGASDHLTASCGVAVAEPGNYMSTFDLKDAADFGLYQAKHNGRNRCYLEPVTETVK
jgi:two-component system chemotaxis family response regulator WspR